MMNKFKISMVLWSCFFWPLFPCSAGPYLQHDFTMISDTDNVNNFAYGSMKNTAFFGASLGGSGQIIIGQNVMMWNRSYETASQSVREINMLELGPRAVLFFNVERTFFVSFAYNIYAKGTRTLSTGSEEELSGSALYFSAGQQLKISKMFYLGASLNYHSLSVSEKVDTDKLKSDVSETYTSMYPALDLSVRF